MADYLPMIGTLHHFSLVPMPLLSSRPSEPPPRFEYFRRKAERVTRNPKRVRTVVREAYDKIAEHREEIGQIRTDLPVLLRLVRAWLGGEYRRVPLKAIVLIVGAVLYFLNPLDLIPDFLPVVGYLDDAAVLSYVLRTLHAEVELYGAWEAQHQLPAPDLS
ncbi:MAG: YkvA family protein [Bacteroidota bacterium]